ncbi:MAG TPA: FAD-binding oxidoreductase [Gaiellaceae bacterium]|nr:FAD-binding oxidoreductase [Gaiellaceae bacterium]
MSNLTTSTPDVAALEQELRGTLVRPSDAEYDTARSVWNGMIDRRPAVIVRCAGAADVIAGLHFAREHDLVVAVRGGGHNVAGFGTCDDGVVLDLSAMQEIRVDPRLETARAGGGVLWSEFDQETQAFGLATTGGLVSTTGIAGFTLGGGIGWLMRKHGLACDNLVSADVVTADGRVLTASTVDNEDLFWGLRGGGGNFGVVTSFEFRLHRVGPIVFGGALFYPLAQAAELLGFYREWAPTLPDELTTMIAFLTAPPLPFIPEAQQGTKMVALALCFVGPTDEGEAMIAPLRAVLEPAAEQVGPLPYRMLQGMFDASVPHGIHSYWKTEHLDELEDGAIDVAVAAAEAAASPMSQLHIHHIEGAVARGGAENSAFGRRDSRYIVNTIGIWTEPEFADGEIANARSATAAFHEFSSGGAYLNFFDADEGDERIRAAYGPDKYERLVALKDRYDPGNVFRLNQNIKPSAAA